jgi:hypothetical protein
MEKALNLLLLLLCLAVLQLEYSYPTTDAGIDVLMIHSFERILTHFTP